MNNPYHLDDDTPAKQNSGHDSPSGENGIQRPMRMAASPQDNAVTAVALAAKDQRPQHPMPVWMQRTYLIIYVLFCLEIGLMLTLVPWTQAWNHNSYIFTSAWVRSLLQTGFVRGMVTGVGLIDIWLGIWEAVQYRDERPVAQTR